MKRLIIATNQLGESREVEKFLSAYVLLCRKHKMMLEVERDFLPVVLDAEEKALQHVFKSSDGTKTGRQEKKERKKFKHLKDNDTNQKG